MAAGSLYFTSAPITPSDVTLKFSKILVFVEVFKKGYRNKGIWAKLRYIYHEEIIVLFDDVELNIEEAQLLSRSY